VEDNRAYLKAVIESILFCARQGIPLRGHGEGIDSTNQGNLQELMRLRSNDNELIRRFMINREKYFTYLHSSCQNEIIEIMASQVQDSMVGGVKEAGVFSTIADETMDLLKHKQVALILRYVNPSFEIQERFVGFYRMLQTDSHSLATLIKSTLSALGLDPSALRGQCYDGAASMRGAYKGVATLTRKENPLACYVHCYALILNLCIVDMVSSIPVVRNAFRILQALQTAVLENFDEVVEALYEIANGDSKAGGEAYALLRNVQDFNFLYCMFFMRRVLMQTNHLSKLLQKCDAMILHPKSFITSMNCARKTIILALVCLTKGSFPKNWEERQKNWKTGYYRSGILYHTLDTLINEIKDRFSENDLSIFVSLLDVLSSECPSEEGVVAISTAYSIDQEDLNSEIQIFFSASTSRDEEELTQFERKLQFFRKTALRDTIPNLANLFVFYLSIPVTSALAKRSFSSLRQLKIYLRTTMTDARVSALAILQVEKGQAVNTSDVITTFTSKKDRC
uniref:HAT C-terminal dimerisation domain-containing protein n=1 Tax=Latimeria chalumnae TaxID=7897 RepID=H3AE53_LATCH